MAESTYRIEDLEVVGYADTLDESFVPTLVPPVFRLRDDPDRVLLPPFEIKDDQVVEVLPGAESDLERAVLRGQATRLDEAIDAESDHQLWIDEELQPHYGVTADVLDGLRRLAKTRAREAQNAVTEGRLADAERLAQAAISADDGCLNAILVKALIETLQGNEDQVEVLIDVAENIVPGADFRAWIHFFSGLARGFGEICAPYPYPAGRVSHIAEEPGEYDSPDANLRWQATADPIEGTTAGAAADLDTDVEGG